MIDIAQDLIREVTSHAMRLGPRQWFLVLLGVMAAGGLCMRGFGSRASY